MGDMMKFAKNLLIVAGLFQLNACDEEKRSSLASEPRCERAVVFFDLGQTIVDTSNFEKIIYMPEATAYLHQLAENNYPVGLLANIPESWGATYEEKLAATKSFIGDRWDPAAAPFDWDAFGARVLLPLDDERRKPHLDMFQRAKAIADAAGCPAVFQGEVPAELEAAMAVGLIAYEVGQVGASFYMPESELRKVGLPDISRRCCMTQPEESVSLGK